MNLEGVIHIRGYVKVCDEFDELTSRVLEARDSDEIGSLQG